MILITSLNRSYSQQPTYGEADSNNYIYPTQYYDNQFNMNDQQPQSGYIQESSRINEDCCTNTICRYETCKTSYFLNILFYSIYLINSIN